MVEDFVDLKRAGAGPVQIMEERSGVSGRDLGEPALAQALGEGGFVKAAACFIHGAKRSPEVAASLEALVFELLAELVQHLVGELDASGLPRARARRKCFTA
jgi:hypothetical protein